MRATRHGTRSSWRGPWRARSAPSRCSWACFRIRSSRCRNRSAAMSCAGRRSRRSGRLGTSWRRAVTSSQSATCQWRAAWRGRARRTRARLLVVGSSPSAEQGRIAIGGRTRQLLQHAGCPLAVATRGLHERGGPALRTIGVGFDGGPEATAALELAGELAARGGRKAARAQRGGGPAARRFEYAAPLEWESLIEERRGVMEERLASAAGGIGCAVQTEVLIGSPAADIAGLSESVDLLVVGSRRWGPICATSSRRHGRGAPPRRCCVPRAAGPAAARELGHWIPGPTVRRIAQRGRGPLRLTPRRRASTLAVPSRRS